MQHHYSLQTTITKPPALDHEPATNTTQPATILLGLSRYLRAATPFHLSLAFPLPCLASPSPIRLFSPSPLRLPPLGDSFSRCRPHPRGPYLSLSPLHPSSSSPSRSPSRCVESRFSSLSASISWLLSCSHRPILCASPLAESPLPHHHKPLVTRETQTKPPPSSLPFPRGRSLVSLSLRIAFVVAASRRGVLSLSLIGAPP